MVFRATNDRWLWEPSRPRTFDSAEIEQSIGQQLGDAAGEPVQVRCPDRLPAEIGRINDCAARLTREPTGYVLRVIVQDEHGHYRWEQTSQTVSWASGFPAG